MARPLPVVRRRQDSQGELLQLINLFGGLDREPYQVRDVNAIENGSGCTPGLIGDVALRARRRTGIPLRTVIQGSAGAPKYSTAGTPEVAPSAGQEQSRIQNGGPNVEITSTPSQCISTDISPISLPTGSAVA
jgi:hypothetical protein